MRKSGTCPACGAGFEYQTTGGRPRVFCGRTCSIKSHNAKRRGTCIDCGKPVVRSTGRCSSCNGKHRRKKINYKRGWHRLPSGYIYLSGHQEHPNANGVGQIAEHVLVMTQKLGRAMVKGESVHHLNGIRDDNRPENLELWSRAQPAGQRVKDKVAFALELVRLYVPQLLKDPQCELPSPVVPDS